ncbi:MAG: CaiB/BaiF CoA-transferase family protein [Pseudomonadales bacterium]
MTQAFDGIRIIDFTQVLAGPFAVMQLALLGADVIKVEQPVTGDQTRGLMNESGNAGMSPSFLTCNVNKKSLTLNLKAREARTILTALVKTADVIVENFKSGTMDRMGFGYEDLKAINPGIIYCSVTGYGQTGPKAGAAAYDGAIQASSGMMSQTGHRQTGPTRTGYMPVDMATSLNTAFAVSAALYRRAVTGVGQMIDVAMLDTAIVAQAAQFSNYLNAGNLVGLNGNASPTGQPTADVFPTLDGLIQVTALRQPQVETLFEIIGETQALGQEALATPTARMAHPEEVKTCVSAALQKNTTAFWMEKLEAAGVPVAEVRTLPEVVADPQLKFRGVLEKIPSPVRTGDTVTIVKAGYITDADGPSVRFAPPGLGEHTREILLSLGFSESTIAEWDQAGIIGLNA